MENRKMENKNEFPRFIPSLVVVSLTYIKTIILSTSR